MHVCLRAFLPLNRSPEGFSCMLPSVSKKLKVASPGNCK